MGFLVEHSNDDRHCRQIKATNGLTAILEYTNSMHGYWALLSHVTEDRSIIIAKHPHANFFHSFACLPLNRGQMGDLG